jgi:hypothetical protein
MSGAACACKSARARLHAESQSQTSCGGRRGPLIVKNKTCPLAVGNDESSSQVATHSAERRHTLAVQGFLVTARADSERGLSDFAGARE